MKKLLTSFVLMLMVLAFAESTYSLYPSFSVSENQEFPLLESENGEEAPASDEWDDAELPGTQQVAIILTHLYMQPTNRTPALPFDRHVPPPEQVLA